MFNENTRLDEMDRGTVERILEPIIDLRLACNHPQLVLRKRSFNAHHQKARKHRLLTMQASLEILTKKTQIECDNHFRACVMHMNGMAGLSILMEKRDLAIVQYKEVLSAAQEEYSGNVRLDNVQKVHTLYNYTQLLIARNDPADDKTIKSMQDEMKLCESQYLASFEEKKAKSVTKFTEKESQINEKLKEVRLAKMKSSTIFGFSSS